MSNDQADNRFRELSEVLEAAQQRNADLSEEEAMALATEAVKAVRQERRAELERLRAEIQRGIDSGEAEPMDMDAITAEAEARYQKRQEQEWSEK